MGLDTFRDRLINGVDMFASFESIQKGNGRTFICILAQIHMFVYTEILEWVHILWNF